MEVLQMMNKMSSITFPDGSSYEVTDDKARKDIVEINNNVSELNSALDDRYSHNTNNIQFPFTAPHSGILSLCLTIGVGTAGVVGNMVTVKSADGYIRYPYCIGYCNGWGAITFPIPLAKGDTVTLAEKFSGEYNGVYADRTYFTY